MKFPSIKSLVDNALITIKRFPFEISFALLGTIAATVNINKAGYISNPLFTRVLMTANLGLLLSLAATLFVESRVSKNGLLIRIVAAVIGASFFLIFSKILTPVDYLRFTLLSFSFHLLVSFSAFATKGHIHGFWQFNKALFLRILTSVLYSGVLFLGLCAAIGASNFLFNMNFTFKVYSTLFACIAGMFNTIFFLAGVPANIFSLNDDESYPKGLKIFTQYVLIPLASVYVIILIAYEGKILVQWSLPKGLVSNLILGYAVFGILSILLIYPVRNKDENKWIKTYSHSFYILLVPLLALLCTAVITRVVPYGITPSRYFLVLLAGWLLFITIYFLFSKKQNIKVIPITLAILSLLAVYGPQSAFSTTKYSQLKRLSGFFERQDKFKNGKLVSLNKSKIDSADGANIINQLNYFVFNLDVLTLQPILNKDINNAVDSIRKAKQAGIAKESYPYLSEYEVKNDELEWLVNNLGVSRFYNQRQPSVKEYAFDTKYPHLIETQGYDYVLGFSYIVQSSDDTAELSGGKIKIKQLIRADHVYELTLNSEKVSFDAKKIADSPVQTESKLTVYKQANNYGMINYKMPNEMLSITKQTMHYKVTFKMDNLRFNLTKNDNIVINQVDGAYLISILQKNSKK